MEAARTPTMIEKLVQLGEGLRRAGEFFDQNAPDAGRLGASLALGNVNEFLSGVLGADPAMFVPLRQLQYALADLDRGKVVPLLAPKKVGHRPPDAYSKEAFRAVAAAAMDVMMVAGEIGKKEAARVAARELSSLGYQDQPGKRITGPMVEDWRERVMTESPAQNLAAGRFMRFRKFFQDHPPDDPRARAREMLRNLARVAPPGNPKKPPS